jgi:glycosyltransferase involved in cell wall biosynthesis
MAIDDFLNANERRDEVRQELGFADHHIVVGKIARLFKLKGHEYLVDAARQIVERNPDVHFLLVGDGNLRSEIVRQIEAGGLTGHFHFTGLVPPTDVPKYIGAMDILAHTSLREGLARALPQALLAGKPVISFDIDGAREVCITDETGILTAPQDVATLVDGICRLAADRDLREQLGTAGKTKCREMYSHQLMTDRIRAIYEEVIAETQGK